MRTQWKYLSLFTALGLVVGCSHATLKSSPEATPVRELASSLEFRLLGSTTLTANMRDSDVIEVAGRCPSMRAPWVQEVQLRVYNASVEIDDVILELGNGEKLPLEFKRYDRREIFRPGEISTNIRISRGALCVERIYIRGRTMDIGHRPDPRRRDPRDPNPRRPVPPRVEGKVEIWGIQVEQDRPRAEPYLDSLGIVPLSSDGIYDQNPRRYSINLGSCRNPNNNPISELQLKV